MKSAKITEFAELHKKTTTVVHTVVPVMIKEYQLIVHNSATLVGSAI